MSDYNSVISQLSGSITKLSDSVMEICNKLENIEDRLDKIQKTGKYRQYGPSPYSPYNPYNASTRR